jgi:hypothetical protein
MGQGSVEILIGRLVTDDGLRRRFIAELRETIRLAQQRGLVLTAAEIDAFWPRPSRSGSDWRRPSIRGSRRRASSVASCSGMETARGLRRRESAYQRWPFGFAKRTE